ncbi:ccr4 associated factor [Tulasnella sp. JGI-2019a]|nr:ccr4 associated factor [Tulasnella sp. JGI-2019a]
MTTVPMFDPTSDAWDKNGRPAVYSAFLSAQGRIMYDVLIYPYMSQSDPSSSSLTPGYIIEYDPRAADDAATSTSTAPSSNHGATPTLMSMLKRYILRSKVRVKDVSDEWKLHAMWSSEPGLSPFNTKPDDWRWGRSGAVEPIYQHHPEGNDPSSSVHSWVLDSGISEKEALWALDRRAPGMGVRVLLRADSAKSPLALSSPDDYTLHRIKLGVPEGKDDMAPQDSFPMDANMDLMGGVDFRKGCYVGQELTVRTYHTGVIRKRTVPVQVKPSSSSSISGDQASAHSPLLPPQSPIHASWRTTSESAAKPRPRGSGRLLSSVGGYALALMRLEQMEAAEAGSMALNVEHEGVKWDVIPHRPEWWPVQVPETDGNTTSS